jgi:hypothetical protein
MKEQTCLSFDVLLKAKFAQERAQFFARVQEAVIDAV